MGDTPAVDAIRESEQSGDNSGNGGDADGGDSGGGMFDGGIPTFGLTRKQLLLIGLVVVAVLAWKARDSGTDDAESGTKADEEIEKAHNPDLGDVTVTEDEDAEDVEVVLPANPDDELEKDQAIIDYFKEAGHISGGEDD